MFRMQKKKAKPQKQVPKKEADAQNSLKPYENQLFSADLNANLEKIKNDLGNSKDLLIRQMTYGNNPGFDCAILYIDGLIDQAIISEFVMQTLMVESEKQHSPQIETPDNFFSFMKEKSLTLGDVKEIENWKSAYADLFSGKTLIFVDGSCSSLTVDTNGGEKRAVAEPATQTVIRGPREGFTESIRTNTALIRRKIRNPRLWLEQVTIGTVTQTEVGVMYLKGIARDDVVQEVTKRLHNIQVDSILESGNIEEFIEDTPFTPFPTIYHSERPDAIAAGLLEGRVAILVDGTPFVLLVPCSFSLFFQSPEDYYQRFDVGSLLRMLRYACFFVSLLLPSFYVALKAYHLEMIPTPLLLKLASQREGVPFPVFVEAFMMEIIFEVLREAGIRMPTAVGSTISIIGGLVIGQSAVAAGLISPAIVIVVSLTAITSYVVPSYNLSISSRILRFLLLFGAATFGMYGIAVLLLIILLHLCSLNSFGIPYLKPFFPIFWKEWKDTVIRAPFWAMRTRPALVSQDKVREQTPLPNGQETEGDTAKGRHS